MSKNKTNEDIETEDGHETPSEDSQRYWRRHVQVFDKQMMGCRLCGYRQVGASALKRHILAVHLNFSPFACKYCHYATTEIRYVRQHIEKAHPGLACRVIRRKYVSEPNRESHTEHVAGAATSAVLVGQVAHASEMYYGTPNRTREDNSASVINLINNKSVSSKKKSNARLYKCIYCDFCSKDRFMIDIRDHIFTVHLNRDHFQCEICRFGSMRRDAVVTHSLSTHPGKYMKVTENRTYSHEITVLESHGNVRLVGVLSPDRIPLIELPEGTKDRQPLCNDTLMTAPTTQHDIGPTARRDFVVEGSVVCTIAKRKIKLAEDNRPTKHKDTSSGKKIKFDHDCLRVTEKNGETAYLCDLCEHKVRMKLSIINHRQSHFKFHPLGCGYCEYKTSSRFFLVSHCNGVHAGRPLKNRVISRTSACQGKASICGDREEVAMNKDGDSVSRSAPCVGNLGSNNSDDEGLMPTFKGMMTSSKQEDLVTQPMLYADDNLDCDNHDDDGLMPTFQCMMCGRKMLLKSSVERHVMVEHLDYRPYACSFCEYSSINKSAVRTHIAKQHRGLQYSVVYKKNERLEAMVMANVVQVQVGDTPEPVALTTSLRNLVERSVVMPD